MRLSRFLLVFLFSSSSAAPSSLEPFLNKCDPFFNCLLIRMFANLSDIAKSDVYPLTSNLFVKKVSNVSENNFLDDVLPKINRYSSRPWKLTQVLLMKTSKILETHSLNWIPNDDVTVKMYPSEVRGRRALDVALEVAASPPRDGRTFGIGAHRKMMMALLPMMFKLGVITTLLVALTVLVLKGLGVGVILMILGVGNLLGKFYASKHGEWGSTGPSKEVHVHVHNDPEHSHHAPWDRNTISEYYNPYRYSENQRTPYPYIEYPYNWPSNNRQ